MLENINFGERERERERASHNSVSIINTFTLLYKTFFIKANFYLP